MRKKKAKCYLLLGTVIMLVFACICAFAFVKANLNQAAEKKEFESMYTETEIDFIIPAPSYAQVGELETDDNNGIKAVIPYYETESSTKINGSSTKGTTLVFQDASKMHYTPYNAARILSGEKTLQTVNAVIDKRYAELNGCKEGDTVSLSIDGKEYSFTIDAVSANNTYYDGTVALILSEDAASEFENKAIRYSSAYVVADDKTVCEQFLKNGYRPLGRLKDEAEFSNEDAYKEHFENFNNADWSKEITDCGANYDSLSVKYSNVETGIWINIGIMSILVALVVIIFNFVLLKNAEMRSFMKAFLIKKSGTKDDIKAFYKSGITGNAVFYLITSLAFYVLMVLKSGGSLLSMDVLNWVIPAATAIIASVIMSGSSAKYVEEHYRIKKKKDSNEIEVEIV